MKLQRLKPDDLARDKVEPIIGLLAEEYDIPDWQPGDDPVAVLVQTILSQNTSDVNSGNAFRSLLASFETWEEVAEADVQAIAHCIRSGGLGRIKSQRIKQALREIIRQRGKLDLDFLRQLAPSEAEGWLEKLPGVGPKTARCVLLFSLGMPALPVDTHILRVSKRLGLIGSRASLDEAHRVLAELVPAEDAYKFHVMVIEHGRRICQAQRPRCSVCILKELCPGAILS